VGVLVCGVVWFLGVVLVAFFFFCVFLCVFCGLLVFFSPGLFSERLSLISSHDDPMAIVSRSTLITFLSLRFLMPL